MDVNVYECGNVGGKPDRRYLGTFSLESLLRENADAFGEGELDKLERSLKDTGKGKLLGFVGVWHEYVDVSRLEAETSPKM